MSDLVENPEDRFSHDAAQMIQYVGQETERLDKTKQMLWFKFCLRLLLLETKMIEPFLEKACSCGDAAFVFLFFCRSVISVTGAYHRSKLQLSTCSRKVWAYGIFYISSLCMYIYVFIQESPMEDKSFAKYVTLHNMSHTMKESAFCIC